MTGAKETTQTLRNRSISKGILMLSVFVFLYYLTVQVLIASVYQYAFIGALFELLWLPMLLLLFVLPVVCLVQLFRQSGRARVYALAALVLSAATVFVLIRTT